jgi:hypothetical protein
MTRQASETWRGAVGFSGRFSQVAARSEAPGGNWKSEDLTFEGPAILISSPGAFAGPAAQRVQAVGVRGAAAQQPVQRLPRGGAGEHVVADVVQRLPDVIRRC